MSKLRMEIMIAVSMVSFLHHGTHCYSISWHMLLLNIELYNIFEWLEIVKAVGPSCLQPVQLPHQ